MMDLKSESVWSILFWLDYGIHVLGIIKNRLVMLILEKRHETGLGLGLGLGLKEKGIVIPDIRLLWESLVSMIYKYW